jgi:hypothetical protein
MCGRCYMFRHYIAIFRERSWCLLIDAQLRSSRENIVDGRVVSSEGHETYVVLYLFVPFTVLNPSTVDWFVELLVIITTLRTTTPYSCLVPYFHWYQHGSRATENRVSVDCTPISYFRDPGFKFRLGDQLSWFKALFISVPRYYLTWGQDRFHPHAFQSLFTNRSVLWYCEVRAIGSAIK